MDNPDTDNIGYKTQNKDKQTKTQHRKLKKMSSIDPKEKQGVKSVVNQG